MRRIPASFLLLFLFSFQSVSDRSDWPKEINAKSGAVITIYQPQPESMKGDRLNGRAAFSAQIKPADDLIFGVFWFTASMATDRDTRTATLESIVVSDVKLPGVDDASQIAKLKDLLESEIPTWEISSSLDEIAATIEQEHQYFSPGLKNDAPAIHFKTEPTTLILIDGEPRLQEDKDLKMKRVINTAFLIVESPDDKMYYLYGDGYWYASSSLKDGYARVTKVSGRIASIDEQIKKKEKEESGASPAQQAAATPPTLMISTTPAELIQSKGPPTFASIAGTGLLYMTNTDDDIFRSVEDENYYILLSGRWYASPKLDGTWIYVASDKLPADFKKIPEGSSKDNVLVSVAGTPASKDAIMDAQVPQTAKVDRKTATCKVTYDGEPKFEKIEGTSLELAVNTSSTVLKSGNQYYCVETGVWFAAGKPTGPWKASDQRPKEVEKIPPDSPAYNVQYVYIYDSTPEVVYVGYTPGYMGCYVYGPTVVYGTGYYYNPWYGPYYYPRPVTYGFSMHYNPWTGWSMGFHFSSGYFHYSGYHHPGYWGPPMYRPPYYPPYRGGMYGGRGPTYINGDVNINRGNSNNIYNGRNDVATNDVRRGQGGKPSSMDQRNRTPTAQPANRAASGNAGNNNVYSDKSGNVYQRNENGNWNQRDGNQWKQTEQPSNMNRDYENRQRSSYQNSNYQQMNRGGNLGGSYGSGGGGGGRRR